VRQAINPQKTDCCSISLCTGKGWEPHKGEIGQQLEYGFNVQEAVAEGAWFSFLRSVKCWQYARMECQEGCVEY
jgi:hypothetical protein